MSVKNSGRVHIFQFPGDTGSFTLELKNGCFPDITDEELFKIGKVLRDFLYGLMIEDRPNRRNFLNIFYSALRDSALTLEDKDLSSLLRFSSRAFHEGDYGNSLFLSKYILARINRIIDDKIAHNSNKVDREVIHLQISTLNFIGYLFSKMGKNIDYGLKLAIIANTLLNEFDENNKETKSLRAAVLDTIGVLYIEKGEWDKAIEHLSTAHEYDKVLLSLGQIDAIGFRLTCSNLGYALVKKCSALLEDDSKAVNIHEIENYLRKARLLFNMVKVDRPPVVPEHSIKDLELLSAIKRMKKGLGLEEEVRKKLQRRFI